MKKIGLVLLVLMLFCAVPGFTQIASIHYAEAFPELCIWISGIPLVMAEGAESVRYTHWAESPMEGRYDTGYSECFYGDGFLLMRIRTNENGDREYTASYLYEDGYLMEIDYDYPDTLTNDVYYFDHYDDRTEVYFAQRSVSITKGKGEPFETEGEWVKTLWYDTSSYLTKIEAPDWERIFYYNDGFLIRAEEITDGQNYATVYTYNDQSLLESIDVERQYTITIKYNRQNEVSGINLNSMYQTTVYGDLEIARNGRGDFTRIGPTELEWKYADF